MTKRKLTGNPAASTLPGDERMALAKVLATNRPFDYRNKIECCRAAGIPPSNRRIVRTHKAMYQEIGKIFQGRERVRAQLTKLAITLDLSSKDLRHLGWQFKEETRVEALRKMCVARQYQFLLPGTRGNTSSTSKDAESEDVLKWLAHLTAHAAYDLQSPSDFQQTMDKVLEQLGQSPLVRNAITEHKTWLVQKHHSRHAWEASRCSQKIVAAGSKLGPEARVAFLVLVYFALNHEDSVDEWSKASSLPNAELPQKIWDIIADRHPVSWRNFPVSTATGLAGGLKKGQIKHLVIYKVCLLASLQVRVVQAMHRKHDGIMQDWKRLQASTQGSALQCMMVSRVWCKIAGLPQLNADEVWTNFSKPEVPLRWQSSTPGQLGRALQKLAQKYPVVLEMAELTQIHGVDFWGGARVEHQGCEIRKCREGACFDYKRRKTEGKPKTNPAYVNID